jgi:hypothetical protein
VPRTGVTRLLRESPWRERRHRTPSRRLGRGREGRLVSGHIGVQSPLLLYLDA